MEAMLVHNLRGAAFGMGQEQEDLQAAECGSSEEGEGGELGDEAKKAEKKAPPFLLRLYEMVNDPASKDVIYWNLKAKPIEGVPCGTAFTVIDNGRMEKELIPHFYKHSNFTSFIRQLNQYRFRKLDPKTWTFGHEFFLREHPELLQNIKRKRKPSRRREDERRAAMAAMAAAAAGDPLGLYGPAMQEIRARQELLTTHVQSVGDLVAQVVQQQVCSRSIPLNRS